MGLSLKGRSPLGIKNPVNYALNKGKTLKKIRVKLKEVVW